MSHSKDGLARNRHCTRSLSSPTYAVDNGIGRVGKRKEAGKLLLVLVFAFAKVRRNVIALEGR